MREEKSVQLPANYVTMPPPLNLGNLGEESWKKQPLESLVAVVYIKWQD
jgi:hypothetical protein